MVPKTPQTPNPIFSRISPAFPQEIGVFRPVNCEIPSSRTRALKRATAEPPGCLKGGKSEANLNNTSLVQKSENSALVSADLEKSGLRSKGVWWSVFNGNIKERQRP